MGTESPMNFTDTLPFAAKLVSFSFSMLKWQHLNVSDSELAVFLSLQWSAASQQSSSGSTGARKIPDLTEKSPHDSQWWKMMVIPVLAARNTMATSMDIIDDMVFGIFTGAKILFIHG